MVMMWYGCIYVFCISLSKLKGLGPVEILHTPRMQVLDGGRGAGLPQGLLAVGWQECGCFLLLRWTWRRVCVQRRCFVSFSCFVFAVCLASDAGVGIFILVILWEHWAGLVWNLLDTHASNLKEYLEEEGIKLGRQGTRKGWYGFWARRGLREAFASDSVSPRGTHMSLTEETCWLVSGLAIDTWII